MTVALRVIACVVGSLACGAAVGAIAYWVPDYHPHDVVGPLLFAAVGSLGAFVVALVVSLLVVFAAFSPRKTGGAGR